MFLSSHLESQEKSPRAPHLLWMLPLPTPCPWAHTARLHPPASSPHTPLLTPLFLASLPFPCTFHSTKPLQGGDNIISVREAPFLSWNFFCATYERRHKIHLLNDHSTHSLRGASECTQPQALGAGKPSEVLQVRRQILKMRKLRPKEGRAHGLPFVELTPTPPSAPGTVPTSHPPVSGPHAGSCGQEEGGGQSPSPVGVAPDPGAGAALQSVHHCVPIVQKGFVQSGKAECMG